MKKEVSLVKLIHNPTAGEGKYSKEEIIKIIKGHGYECSYVSSKKMKSFDDVSPQTEIIAIAGGDGTIRKTVINLLDKKLKYKRPLTILPLGTANNVATSLGIHKDVNKNISTWKDYQLRKFDIGQISGMKKAAYFIESLGFGLFPKLIKTAKKANAGHLKTPEDEFDFSLAKLLKLTQTYPAVSCTIEIDGNVIEKNCLMVEILNISRLGPKLTLSENADPGDGYFDVIIVPEEKRDAMAKYIQDIIKDKKAIFPIKPILAKKIAIKWKGKDIHIDDEINEKAKKFNLEIYLLNSLLEVIVNKKESD